MGFFKFWRMRISRDVLAFTVTTALVLWLVGLCPCSEALSCYVNHPLSNEERVIDCQHVFQIPTVAQMDRIHSTNSDLKRVKISCWKHGPFEKGCALVTEDQKMNCGRTHPSDPEVEQIMTKLSSPTVAQKATTGPLRQCFCDTDRCNSAPRPGAQLASTLSVPLFTTWALFRGIIP